MRRVERRAMDRTGTPSQTLMERAAAHVADAALPYLRGGGALLVACGTGNNGGDGLAAARLLLSRLPALRATVWRLAGEPTAEAAAQWEKLKPFAGRVTIVQPGEPLAVPAGAALVIDALFGTGLNRPLAGAARAMVEAVNASGLPVVAVDIPSGLSGETGFAPEAEEESPVVRADVTVTFHRPKPGLFLGDGPDYCGRVAVADIGIPPAWDDAGGMAMLAPATRCLRRAGTTPIRAPTGRVLACAGSRGMAGGRGRVRHGGAARGRGTGHRRLPRRGGGDGAGTVPLRHLPAPARNGRGRRVARLTEALDKADALVAGCGLGREALAARAD
jgi:NAD(P)H-hydrate epimerase